MPTYASTTPIPDLLGMRVAHRGMLADSQRFAMILDQIASGAPCLPRRSAAISEYLTDLVASIEHHHTTEDLLLWPLLEEKAGAAVDLTALSDDHEQLDDLLDELDVLIAAFSDTAKPEVDAAPLGQAVHRLHRLLSEHIADEEAALFPIIELYLTCEEWQTVEESARKGGKLGFELPRFLVHTSAAEQQRMLAAGGVGLRVMVGVVNATAGRKFRRREEVIAGRVS